MIKLNKAYPESLKATDSHRRHSPKEIITEDEINRVFDANKNAARHNNEASSLFFWGIVFVGLSILFDIPIQIFSLLK